MRLASNIFAAGGETTARLLATSFRNLGEQADQQDELRADRELIPNFVEEALRFESPIKGDFRLSRVATTVGGVDLPAGTTVMVINGAANRDPRLFDTPLDFQVDRPNARQHVAFGHGIHTCAGAPLARAEAVVTINRFLDRMRDIRVSEAHHGPAGARTYQYDPTFILRGLRSVHLEYTPTA
jgi:cytochrome P450